MGNLPTSRTITLNTGDPIPSNLLNEIQDNIVANRRSSFTKGYPIDSVYTSAGTASLVDDPLSPNGKVWKLTTGNTYLFRVRYENGDVFESAALDVVGDGAGVDWVLVVANISSAHPSSVPLAGSALGPANIDQPPGAWAIVNSNLNVSGTPLLSNGFVVFSVAVTGGAFLWVRGAYLTMHH